MSIYSDISKKIGYDHSSLPYPTKEEAQEILNKVNNKDLEAFEMAFRYYRFLPIPTDTYKQEALDLIVHAYKMGVIFWKD